MIEAQLHKIEPLAYHVQPQRFTDLFPKNFLNSPLNKQESFKNRINALRLVLAILQETIDNLLTRKLELNPLTGRGDCHVLALMILESYDLFESTPSLRLNALALRQKITQALKVLQSTQFDHTRDHLFSTFISQLGFDIHIDHILGFLFLCRATTITNHEGRSRPEKVASLGVFQRSCSDGTNCLSRSSCVLLVHHWQKMLSNETVLYLQSVSASVSSPQGSLGEFVSEAYIRYDSNGRPAVPVSAAMRVVMERLCLRTGAVVVVRAYIHSSKPSVHRSLLIPYRVKTRGNNSFFDPIVREDSLQRVLSDPEQYLYVIEGETDIGFKAPSNQVLEFHRRKIVEADLQHIVLANCAMHPEYLQSDETMGLSGNWLEAENALYRKWSGCSKSDSSLFLVVHMRVQKAGELMAEEMLGSAEYLSRLIAVAG